MSACLMLMELLGLRCFMFGMGSQASEDVGGVVHVQTLPNYTMTVRPCLDSFCSLQPMGSLSFASVGRSILYRCQRDDLVVPQTHPACPRSTPTATRSVCAHYMNLENRPPFFRRVSRGACWSAWRLTSDCSDLRTCRQQLTLSENGMARECGTQSDARREWR